MDSSGNRYYPAPDASGTFKSWIDAANNNVALARDFTAFGESYNGTFTSPSSTLDSAHISSSTLQDPESSLHYITIFSSNYDPSSDVYFTEEWENFPPPPPWGTPEYEEWARWMNDYFERRYRHYLRRLRMFDINFDETPRKGHPRYSDLVSRIKYPQETKSVLIIVNQYEGQGAHPSIDESSEAPQFFNRRVLGSGLALAKFYRSRGYSVTICTVGKDKYDATKLGESNPPHYNSWDEMKASINQKYDIIHSLGHGEYVAKHGVGTGSLLIYRSIEKDGETSYEKGAVISDDIYDSPNRAMLGDNKANMRASEFFTQFLQPLLKPKGKIILQHCWSSYNSTDSDGKEYSSVIESIAKAGNGNVRVIGYSGMAIFTEIEKEDEEEKGKWMRTNTFKHPEPEQGSRVESRR